MQGYSISVNGCIFIEFGAQGKTDINNIFLMSSFDRNATFISYYCIMINYSMSHSISVKPATVMKLHEEGHIYVMITICMSSIDKIASFAVKK